MFVLVSDLRDPVCDDCIAFGGERRDQAGVVYGRCRFRSELGEIPQSYPICGSFHVRRERTIQLRMPVSPKRVAGAPRHQGPSARTVTRTLRNPTVGDTEGEMAVDRSGLKQVLRELLQEETMYGYPEMGQRWVEGTLLLKPSDPTLQAKEVPLDKFFHKVVMVRDRLRVLEAKINSNDTLAPADKVELQSYISKIYGTLTTFNVLFADKADQFSS